MADWDIAVLSTRGETLSLTMLEAWALGVPLVSTRVSGVAGFAADGKDALLVGFGDADEMLWWHGPSAESLQAAYRAVGALAGERLAPVWSQVGLHRPAEFNRSHDPAVLADERARDWVCVYPFVRSYEWYLLEESERRAMLVEHGQMGRDYPDVRANTVAAFALGDYEWLLAFEADELHRIVDLMRHLRGSTARRHVREEIPFYTGRRMGAGAVDDLLA